MANNPKSALRYIDGQIIQRFARVMQWHAMVTSGVYKQRKVYRGTLSDPNSRELSDEEKLADSIATLGRHCELLDELIEHLPAGSKETGR